MSRTKPTVFAVFSDVHANSTVSACPPQGVELDDGQRVIPSKVQVWLYEQWCDYWDFVERIVYEVKGKLICASNGDAMDGTRHHDTPQVMTRDDNGQTYLVQELFNVPRKLKPKKWYVIRGTEVHVGPSGTHEENLARWLRAEPGPDAGTRSRWHLRLELHGVLFDLAHHPGVAGGKLPWTRASAMNRQAALVWNEHVLAGERPPDVVIRSHRHVYQDNGPPIPTVGYPMRSIITPPWQLKTAFAHRVAQESISTVGALVFVVEPDGTYTMIPKLYQPGLPAIEVGA